MPDNLPHYFLKQLEHKFGNLLELKELGGMSEASVWRATFEKRCTIIKASKDVAEYHFYKDIKPHLHIAVPYLYADFQDEHAWLAIEDLARLLAKDQFDNYEARVTYLKQLHQTDIHLATNVSYAARWSNEMTEKALSFFIRPNEIRKRLEPFQTLAQPLFEPVCFVSADPNPNNWGFRKDSTLVLFDWARYTRAHPAIDLAIIIAGWGSKDIFEEVARIYLEGNESESNILNLDQKIGIAKLWTLVEMLSYFFDFEVTANPYLEKLTQALENLLSELDEFVLDD